MSCQRSEYFTKYFEIQPETIFREYSTNTLNIYRRRPWSLSAFTSKSHNTDERNHANRIDVQLQIHSNLNYDSDLHFLRPETILSPAVAVHMYFCTEFYSVNSTAGKNLAAVELLLRPDCGRPNFFSAAAAKYCVLYFKFLERDVNREDLACFRYTHWIGLDWKFGS